MIQLCILQACRARPPYPANGPACPKEGGRTNARNFSRKLSALEENHRIPEAGPRPLRQVADPGRGRERRTRCGACGRERRHCRGKSYLLRLIRDPNLPNPPEIRTLRCKVPISCRFGGEGSSAFPGREFRGDLSSYKRRVGGEAPQPPWPGLDRHRLNGSCNHPATGLNLSNLCKIP